MIEVVYKEENMDTGASANIFRLPKNIRQIGLCGGKYRVYMEDYVYTFINRLSEKSEGEQGSLAILMGSTEWNEGNAYIFIKGAVYLEESVSVEHICLDNDFWKKVEEAYRRYFKEMEVVGWFFAASRIQMDVSEILARNHLKYFAGGEKILMLMEPQEKEEAFFCYENDRFIKLPGYYLYYEKNKEMQEYLIANKWWEISEKEQAVPDDAVKSIRKIFAKKSEKEESSGERMPIFSYAATACLVFALVAAGTGFVRNYQKIQQDENLEASIVFTADDQPVSITPVIEKEPEQEPVTDKIQNKSREKKQEEAQEEEMQTQEQETSSNPLETYMIRPGDTLYQISLLNYGNMDAITEICRLNNISEEEKIYPGQIIVLP